MGRAQGTEGAQNTVGKKGMKVREVSGFLLHSQSHLPLPSRLDQLTNTYHTFFINYLLVVTCYTCSAEYKYFPQNINGTICNN